jgi:ATP-dependent Lon protease
MKIIHPRGEATQEEKVHLLELALEGRRRVKEQLKKLGSFEYHQVFFSYIVNDTGEERFVGVPEQGGRNLIPPDPPGLGTLVRSPICPRRLRSLRSARPTAGSSTGVRLQAARSPGDFPPEAYPG